MTDEAVIKGTYIQLQTYKERPYVTLHIDFPEEMHHEIVQKLGVPTKGTSKWLAVALLNNEVNQKQGVAGGSDIPQNNNGIPISGSLNTVSSSNGRTLDFDSGNRGSNPRETAKSEGEKLRIRACCLCKDNEFQKWLVELDIDSFYSNWKDMEQFSREYICTQCQITSRSELTTDYVAQEKFKLLDQLFKNWQNEQRWKDNLDKE